MKIKELIKKCREEPEHLTSETFRASIKGKEGLDLRTKLTESLLEEFSQKDIELIRVLYDAELEYTNTENQHANLAQLAYYLFELANLEDIYRIYDGKNCKNMDAGSMMDLEMLTMQKSEKEVLKFLKKSGGVFSTCSSFRM